MNLNLTDEHARVLIAALDLYSRVNMGQLWALAEAIQNAKTKEGCALPDDWSIREQHTDKMAFELFGYGNGASHGICSPHVPASAKTAYDLQCVIRKDIAERENHPKSSVWRGAPLHTNRSVPLATIST